MSPHRYKLSSGLMNHLCPNQYFQLDLGPLRPLHKAEKEKEQLNQIEADKKEIKDAANAKALNASALAYQEEDKLYRVSLDNYRKTTNEDIVTGKHYLPFTLCATYRLIEQVGDYNVPISKVI